MKYFKVIFPSGYKINDYFNDNIDLNIVLSTGQVFFSTFFTISNINDLIEKDNAIYFWSTDMIIVKDLKKETIKNVISEMINNDYLESSCSYIGKINEIFSNIYNYSDLNSDI